MEAYRSGHNGPDSKSCDKSLKLHISYMEKYRSGHNEPHSKCGCPQGHVGSNPTFSATNPHRDTLCAGFPLPFLMPDFLPFQLLMPMMPTILMPSLFTFRLNRKDNFVFDAHLMPTFPKNI